MAAYIESSNLNDAEYFLNHARGLPATTTGKRRLSVYTKASVVFAWMALEEIVRLELAASPVGNHPRRLWDQMDFLIANTTRVSPVAFDGSRASFLAQRRVRNGVAHALSVGAEVTIEQAASCFAYCKAAISAITGFPLIVNGASQS